MGDRYVKSDENNKILCIDSTILYDHSMSETLPHDEIELWHGHPDFHVNKLEEFLENSIDSDISYFLEIDLRYPENKKNKENCSGNNNIHKDESNDYMEMIKPKNYTKAEKLICNWSDKKK